MRFFFLLIFLLHGLLSHAQQPDTLAKATTPKASTRQTDTFTVKRMGIITDTVGQYKVLVGRKWGRGLLTRQLTLLRRTELMSDGTGRELERYLADRRRRRFTGDVWNAIPITQKPTSATSKK